MFLDDKIKVDSQIYSILLSADSSIEKINFGNGYEIKKIRLLDFPYKNQISNGNNKLNVDYYLSKIVEIEHGIEVEYFYCIYKHYEFFIPSLEIKPNVVYTVTDTFELDKFIDDNANEEFDCLKKTLYALQIFHEGNIGVKDIFFKFRYNFLFNKNLDRTIVISDANTMGTIKYALTEDDCNNWESYYDKFIRNYILLKNIIEHFADGLKQRDLSSSFKTYTTVLEMIFLEKNQKSKKECLARRVSCFLEDDNANINTLYNMIKKYYGYRSNSSHEGNESDINLEHLFELEKITRLCVKSLIYRCDSFIVNNSNILWENIKKNLILELKKKVAAKEYCFTSV